jgi:sugar lactone lactonase YvrE
VPRAELILDAHALVGEGPVWLPNTGELLWVDIESSEVHRLDAATRTDTVIDAGAHVGAVLPDEHGGLVLALPTGLARLAAGADAPTPLVDLNATPKIRLNDAKVDPRGRIFVGSMAYDEEPGVGHLWRVDADLTATVVLDGLTISNGLDWSPDFTRMYFNDSSVRHIDVLDFDVETGEATGRRVLHELADDQPGFPDGMTVDAEGNLRVAIWGGHCVLAISPEGALLDRVEVPSAQTASCCFGGPDLRTLYITTATSGLSEAELAPTPHAGGVFAAEVGVAGRPAWRFAG